MAGCQNYGPFSLLGVPQKGTMVLTADHTLIQKPQAPQQPGDKLGFVLFMFRCSGFGLVGSRIFEPAVHDHGEVNALSGSLWDVA